LEAATSRLEDLAVANTNDFREARAAHRGSATSKDSKDPTPQFNTGVFTPEARSSVVEAPPSIEEEKSPVILDYETIIRDLIDPWVAKSEKIGEVVGEQVRVSMPGINLNSAGTSCSAFIQCSVGIPTNCAESSTSCLTSSKPPPPCCRATLRNLAD